MSRQPENTFIASVRRHLSPNIYVVKNNNLYNAGIPDLWLSGPAGDLWVEFKFIALPKRDETVIDLISGKNPAISYLQQEWIRSRSKEGRKVGVIVGSKDGGVWFRDCTWDTTYTTAYFRSLIKPRNELAAIINNLTA